MNKESVYYLIFEELEEFIEEIQLQNQDLRKAKLLLDDLNAEEIVDIDNEIETNNLVAEQVDSIIFILKSIAHARHELDFYEEHEKEYVNDLSEKMFGESILKTPKKNNIS